jgi:hypothetical protein
MAALWDDTQCSLTDIELRVTMATAVSSSETSVDSYQTTKHVHP